MSVVLKVSSSGFYKWLTRPKTNRELRTESLSEQIKIEYEKSNQIYGSPRITQELKKKHRQVSRSYVARLMKRLNLRSRIRKKYKVTTDSGHGYPVAANLLQRDFAADALSQKWVGDITYIKTGSGWVYLTTVIDLADRKVVGWAFSNDMTAANTTVKALKMAIKNRGVKSGLLFHSDRGVQYACDEFRLLLNKSGITQSMSRKGNCWDNAVAESFFKTLKTEFVYHRKFINREVAKLEVFSYIEGFYHAKRTHSSIGYRTPNEMELIYKAKKKLVA